jgi:serine protease
MTTARKAVAAAVFAALAVVAPANAAPLHPLISPPPRLHRAVHWFHWQASRRSLQAHETAFGSTVVLGLASMRDLAPLRARYGFARVQAIPVLHAALVGGDKAQLHALLAGAPGDPRIRYVSPVGPPRHTLAMPNDPLLHATDPATGLAYEWQFAAANVDRALDLSPGSPHILVGTIDTGAAQVPDLAGQIDQRWTAWRNGKLTRDARGNDGDGHGTAVASLIAANADDGFGMAGFGGATHLIAIRDWWFSDVSVAVALMKLDSLGVRIVNMSFGSDAPESPIALDAIHKAAADGMLLVAAAGNSAGPVAHPAADLQSADGVQSYGLAVGASDVHGKLAFFSNYGTNLSLLAPGGYDGPCSGVLVAAYPVGPMFTNSCFPTWTGDGGVYAYVSGTSFAAPEVAGVAALIWAARPQLKNYQVADIIKQSARRDGAGWTPQMGCGVLDAGAALALATGLSSSEWATTDAGGSPSSAVAAELTIGRTRPKGASPCAGC